MTTLDRLLIAGCIAAIALAGFIFLWQLNNFGKRLKKLEDQLNSGNVPKQ